MIFNDFASRLAREYGLFLSALTGRYLSMMSPGTEVSPMSIAQMQSAGDAMRRTYMELADRSVRDFVAQMSGEAMVEATKDFLKRIDSMTAQNIELLVDRMKGMKNNALDAVKENMHGSMGLLLQRQLMNPEYTVKTASGRTYEALGLMTTEARHFAYRTWLHAEMAKLSWTGDLAEVRYADPEHKNNGLVFSMSGNTLGYPSFEDIADRVFHYNSTATIAPHVPA